MGGFDLALPEGSYQYSLRGKGIWFTLEGVFIISEEADSDELIILKAPWC